MDSNVHGKAKLIQVWKLMDELKNDFPDLASCYALAIPVTFIDALKRASWRPDASTYLNTTHPNLHGTAWSANHLKALTKKPHATNVYVQCSYTFKVQKQPDLDYPACKGSVIQHVFCLCTWPISLFDHKEDGLYTREKDTLIWVLLWSHLQPNCAISERRAPTQYYPTAFFACRE